MGKYAQQFAENAIDLSVIRDLTEEDLKDLGVLLGHRRKILRAIAELDAGASTPIEAVSEPLLRGEAQRRHLTVMICDLVGSTSLSARLDPEDMRVVIDAYHAACARITRSYDGFLAEFRGDGILAYFGYPIAHEDDAERTVRAGLDIIAAVGRLETRAAEPLAVRIGIATGVVVIGDLNREGALREHAVVGETPNLAARLQALAEPGTIVVAASTRRLLSDLFLPLPRPARGQGYCRAGRSVGGRRRVSFREPLRSGTPVGSDRPHWPRGRDQIFGGTPGGTR